MERISAEAAGASPTSAALGRELMLWLMERQWKPQRLRTGMVSEAELLQLCLEEVICLREQGEPQLSLGLIELAQSLGLQNPWLDDNRARGLLILAEEKSAHDIWEALATHPDPTVAAEAEAMRKSITSEEPEGTAAVGNAVINLLEASSHGMHPLLSGSHSPDPEELEKACLEEAIRLREEGNPNQSLSLIQTAQQQGMDNPWLEDNRARALVALGQNEEAYRIWQDLRQHEDPLCAAEASGMAEWMFNSLIEPLRQECARYGWRARHLDPDPNQGQSPLDCALLEVIACREADQPAVSLALVEMCQLLGWTSSWLRENQARALVHLDREDEAVHIWKDLLAEEDPFLHYVAEDMLRLYGPGVERAQGCRQAEEKLEAGEPEAAKELLIQALLQDPEASEYRELLLRVIEAQQPPAANDLLYQELREPTLRLEMHQLLLDALEQKLQPEAPELSPA